MSQVKSEEINLFQCMILFIVIASLPEKVLITKAFLGT